MRQAVSLLVGALLAFSTQAATIAFEGIMFPVEPGVERYSVWKLSYPSDEDVWTFPLNTQLGERGELGYRPGKPSERSSNGWVQELRQLLGDGHRIHALDANFKRHLTAKPDGIQEDAEVAGKTVQLEAIPRLNPDFYYRDGLGDTIQFYVPFAYLGEQERQKYAYLAEHDVAMIQSLSSVNHQAGVLTDKLVSPETWVPYERHTLDGDSLAYTLEDPELAEHIWLIRGADPLLYWQPGDDPAIQARTVTLKRDRPLEKLENAIPDYEPLLVMSVVGLKMDRCDWTASQAMNRLLNRFGEPSDTPTVTGATSLKTSRLLGWLGERGCR